MTRIFADASFYIALVSSRDALHGRALVVAESITADELFTSEPVLTEVLDHFGGGEPYLRATALDFVERLRSEELTQIIPQTPDLWDAGLDLYRRRPDKGYGLTDCMSMAICREHRIRRVLTHDHHFAQEGLEILL